MVCCALVLVGLLEETTKIRELPPSPQFLLLPKVAALFKTAVMKPALNCTLESDCYLYKIAGPHNGSFPPALLRIGADPTAVTCSLGPSSTTTGTPRCLPTTLSD